MSVREAARKWFESFHFFDEDYSRYDNGDPNMDWQTLRHSLNQFLADSDVLRAALADDEERVSVPTVPTPAMLEAGSDEVIRSAVTSVHKVRRVWDAMLAGAEKEPRK